MRGAQSPFEADTVKNGWRQAYPALSLKHTFWLICEAGASILSRPERGSTFISPRLSHTLRDGKAAKAVHVRRCFASSGQGLTFSSISRKAERGRSSIPSLSWKQTRPCVRPDGGCAIQNEPSETLSTSDLQSRGSCINAHLQVCCDVDLRRFLSLGTMSPLGERALFRDLAYVIGSAEARSTP